MKRRRESGAAAVEFAFLLPILVLLAFGIIAFSEAYFRSQAMNAAVREGARLAAVGSADVSDVRDAVAQALQDSRFEDTDAGRLAELTINVDVFADADTADNATRMASTLAASDVPCDAPGVVRVDAWVTDATKYAIQIPIFPGRAMDFHAFAIFRCET